MLSRLLALFILVPIIEMLVLIELGRWIGLAPTLGIILLTGIAGAALARREGLSVWTRFQQRIQQGGLPGRELIDGVLILVSGALLLTPGVLTDVIGFLGLLPPSRAVLRRWIAARIKLQMGAGNIHFMRFGTRSTTPPPESPDTAQWGGQAREIPSHLQRPMPPGHGEDPTGT